MKNTWGRENKQVVDGGNFIMYYLVMVLIKWLLTIFKDEYYIYVINKYNGVIIDSSNWLTKQMMRPPLESSWWGDYNGGINSKLDIIHLPS